tara:strand:+ start:636 stop:1151 length:516 start_codon:yes stop_codon:yes gene_type:complete
MKTIDKSQLRKIIEIELKKIIKENLLDGEKSVNLYLDNSLDRCSKNRDLLYDFISFCKELLKINHPVNVEIVSSREENNIDTTAFYSPEDHEIKIYGKDRAIVDICRSIAHEMTHMMQMINGDIKFPVQDAGGEIEDEANAKAGEIIKIFAKSSPERKTIYERKLNSLSLV